MKSDSRSSKIRAYGNQHFQTRDYQAAANVYFQALIVADSPAVCALALSNRASCWQHLGHYKMASIDCERALKICSGEKREKIKSKLTTIRELDEAEIGKSPANLSPSFKNDFGNIKVIENEEKGKSIVAMKDFEKGIDVLEEVRKNNIFPKKKFALFQKLKTKIFFRILLQVQLLKRIQNLFVNVVFDLY